MVEKRILIPGRVRRVPKQFRWVNHRLVRDRHICRCSHEALALYLLLVTVADAEGVSYYSDDTVSRLLSMEPEALRHARRDLCGAGLIAYQRPLYQVLSLEGPHAGQAVKPQRPARGGSGEAMSIGKVLKQAIGGVR